MNRTQISLTKEQYHYLTELARQTGESMSAIVRTAIDRYRAGSETPNKRALQLIGAFEADRHDISIKHDEFLWGDIPSREDDPA